MGNQQMVEIVKALARNAKVLVLDEPTSSLTLQEAARLFERLNQLQRAGAGDHLRLAPSRRSARDLRPGRGAARRQAGRRSADSRAERAPDRQHDGGSRARGVRRIAAPNARRAPRRCCVEGFSRHGVFEDITFTLHEGEVLTFFGLVGAGRTEVARALDGPGQRRDGHGQAARQDPCASRSRAQP